MQEQEFKKKLQNSHKKIISRVMGKDCLRPIKTNIFDYLSGLGVLETKFDVQMRSHFLPWLYDEIFNEIFLKDRKNEEFIEISNNMQNNLLNLHHESFKKRKEDLLNIEKQKILDKEVIFY